jgi:ribosomal protein L11 methyltransferase
MAKDLRRNLRPAGIAILSGLLRRQAYLVLAAHRMQRIYPTRIFRIGEWVVVVLKRKVRSLT